MGSNWAFFTNPDPLKAQPRPGPTQPGPAHLPTGSELSLSPLYIPKLRPGPDHSRHGLGRALMSPASLGPGRAGAAGPAHLTLLYLSLSQLCTIQVRIISIVVDIKTMQQLLTVI